MTPHEQAVIELLKLGKSGEAVAYWNQHCMVLGPRRFDELLEREFGTTVLGAIAAEGRRRSMERELARLVALVEKGNDVSESDLESYLELTRQEIPVPAGLGKLLQAGLEKTTERQASLQAETLIREAIRLYGTYAVDDADRRVAEACELLSLDAPGRRWPDLEDIRARAIKENRAVETWIVRLAQSIRNGLLTAFDKIFRAHPDFVVIRQDERLRLRATIVSKQARELGLALDDEQCLALAHDAGRVLLEARAGSGKTRTLCAKAALAIAGEHLDPDQVLIVAFNKSAAKEVSRRMRRDFGCPAFSNARTFHSLAYQLAKPTKRVLFDEGQHPSQRAQSAFVQGLLERILNLARR